MDKTFILVPGRSSRQGVTLNEGKYTQGYIDETSTLRMHPDDLRDVGVEPGDEVRMWNDVGSVVVPVISAVDECPVGLVFICYGDKSSQLMAGETHGTGMPDSKGLDVWIEAVNAPVTAGISATDTESSDNVEASGQETRGGRSTGDELKSPSVAQTPGSQPQPASALSEFSRSSESSSAPKKTAPKAPATAKKRLANGEREPASTAQVVVVVIGLIALLILLLTSGQ